MSDYTAEKLLKDHKTNMEPLPRFHLLKTRRLITFGNVKRPRETESNLEKVGTTKGKWKIKPVVIHESSDIFPQGAGRAVSR